ncbi:alpha/beta hydrolase family protein [Aquiflexum lacus]|uniref:alpha/beta hydrolase family protein n=1 Tax=Aquiflexum lacus TaxID=2483805 RepID=UPI001895AD0A|nr:alpha/beta hydrolase [Aquiflexum lacus]
MKTLILSFLIFINFSTGTIAQELQGSWKGTLEVMGQKLPLIFHFDLDGEEWKGTMDSPNQGAKGIPLSKVLYNGLMLNFELAVGGISYEGLFVDENIKGTFKQSGMSFPLDLTKDINENNQNKQVNRPQHPKPPFEYLEIPIAFKNEKGGIQLNGLITKPHGEGPFPAVVLVTGSGPQDRNSEIFGHQPFLVIADYLTNQGIVVLRYDERGVGESEGQFSSATSLDFKDDALFALEYLRSQSFVDNQKVGVIGHSEGGLIAWLIGAERSKVDFLVALAPPVVPIPDLMLKQTEDISRSSGSPQELVSQQVSINRKFYNLITTSKSSDEALSGIPDLVDEIMSGYGLEKEILEQQANSLSSTFEKSINPWFYNFIKTNPEEYISKINVPTFAGFGGKDLQVNASQNGNRLVELFQLRSDLLELKVYPELNHLFQKANTGAVSEYEKIEETFNLEVLQDIAFFINGISGI